MELPQIPSFLLGIRILIRIEEIVSKWLRGYRRFHETLSAFGSPIIPGNVYLLEGAP